MSYSRNEHQLDTANRLAVKCLTYLTEALLDDPTVHAADVAAQLLLYTLRTHPDRVAVARAITGAIASDAADTYDCPTCCDYGVIDEDDGVNVREIDCPDCGKD